jgi:hypothetical protein
MPNKLSTIPTDSTGFTQTNRLFITHIQVLGWIQVRFCFADQKKDTRRPALDKQARLVSPPTGKGPLNASLSMSFPVVNRNDRLPRKDNQDYGCIHRRCLQARANRRGIRHLHSCPRRVSSRASRSDLCLWEALSSVQSLWPSCALPAKVLGASRRDP